MRACLLCVLALLAPVSAVDSSAGGSAVQKVIELLDELKVKVQADLEKEGKSFSEYATYCDDTMADKTYAIKTAAREISDLEATIEDSDASIASLTNEIAELGNSIADKNGQLHGATQARKAANVVFTGGEAELIKSIDEVARGITTLKQGQAFLQGKNVKSHWQKVANAVSSVIDAMRLDMSSAHKLQSFVQAAKKNAEAADDDDDLTLPTEASLVQQAPAVPAFESQGGGIIETMEGMEEKAEKTLADLRKKELESQQAFQLLKAGLEQEVEHANQKLSTAQENKAVSEQDKEDATSKMLGTQNSKAADEKFAATLKSECQTKAREWEERSRSGAGEVAAIAKAKDILTTGVTALVQVTRRGGDNSDAVRQRLASMLKDLSRDHSSFALAQLASAATSDPFGKIRGLIESMVAKLQKEAQEDATHEAFCEEELGKSRKQKEIKSAAQDKHKARMDTSATSIAELTQGVSTLQAEITAIDKSQAEASELRSQEKADFQQASSDYRGSAEAVARAVEVLKSYYQGSFVQLRTSTQRLGSQQPEFGGARSDSGGTIISVLEMAQEDFTSLLAESEATEAESQRAYDKLSQENKMSRATKAIGAKGKESEIKSLKVSLEHSTEDYDSVSKEFDAVNLYLAKLEPECVSKGMSYAERKAARTAEIDGLRDALTILEGNGVALVQASRHLRRQQ